MPPLRLSAATPAQRTILTHIGYDSRISFCFSRNDIRLIAYSRFDAELRSLWSSQ